MKRMIKNTITGQYWNFVLEKCVDEDSPSTIGQLTEDYETCLSTIEIFNLTSCELV